MYRYLSVTDIVAVFLAVLNRVPHNRDAEREDTWKLMIEFVLSEHSETPGSRDDTAKVTFKTAFYSYEDPLREHEAATISRYETVCIAW